MIGEEFMPENVTLRQAFPLFPQLTVWEIWSATWKQHIFSFLIFTNTNNHNSDSLIFKLNYTALSQSICLIFSLKKFYVHLCAPMKIN